MKRNQFTLQQLEEAAAASFTYSGVLRFLGLPLTSGQKISCRNILCKLGVDVTHFNRDTRYSSWQLNLINTPELVKRKTTPSLRKWLIESGRDYACEGLPSQPCSVGHLWAGSTLLLDVDHIDGDWRNNTPENLRFLCPNCHSQTETFKNKGLEYQIFDPNIHIIRINGVIVSVKNPTDIRNKNKVSL